MGKFRKPAAKSQQENVVAKIGPTAVQEKKTRKNVISGKKSLKGKIQKRVGLTHIKESVIKPSKNSEELSDIVSEHLLLKAVTLKKKKRNAAVENLKSPDKIPSTKATGKTEGKKKPESKAHNDYCEFENKFNIKTDVIKSAYASVLQLLEKDVKAKNKLFGEEELPIFMQVSCVKVPQCPSRMLRLPLKHSLLTDASEICLISPNVPGIHRKQHERIIEHFEALLEDKGVKNIQTILPYHQLKTEYDSFELKRKLVELHDVFLVDGKISGVVAHHLGNIFYNKRKLPVSIKLHVPKLKENIERALLKSAMPVHSKGDTFIIQVGHTQMQVDQVVENVLAVVEGLTKENCLGGFENVRNLHLKSSVTAAIPFYVTLRNKNSVDVPVVQPKLPKAHKPVSGELSTKLNSQVTVLPSGEVIVTGIPRTDKSTGDVAKEVDADQESDNEEIDEESDSVQESILEEAEAEDEHSSKTTVSNKNKKRQKKSAIKNDEEKLSSEDDDEENVEGERYTKEELAYLQEFQVERIAKLTKALVEKKANKKRKMDKDVVESKAVTESKKKKPKREKRESKPESNKQNALPNKISQRDKKGKKVKSKTQLLKDSDSTALQKQNRNSNKNSVENPEKDILKKDKIVSKNRKIKKTFGIFDWAVNEYTPNLQITENGTEKKKSKKLAQKVKTKTRKPRQFNFKK